MLRKYPPVGSRPGTLATHSFPADTTFSLVAFSNHGVENLSFTEEDLLKDIENNTTHPVHIISTLLESSKTLWLNICGISNHKILMMIGDLFKLHELTIGDIGNVPQRPKFEDLEDYLFFVSCMLFLKEDRTLEREQLSLILGDKFVLTFQERPGDVLEPVRSRLNNPQGGMKKLGSDYLAYAILDTVIDSFFPIVENVGEFLEEIEDQIILKSTKTTLQEIYSAKRQLLMMRRTMWPHREMFSSILHSDTRIIKKNTKKYFRDIYDHTIELMDVVETGREMASSFTDIYLSSISNRLNDVMKVLTIISTIFIPLSFIASVYGMNFPHMPELKYEIAYPLVLLFMLCSASLMLFLFWRKGWLSESSKQ